VKKVGREDGKLGGGMSALTEFWKIASKLVRLGSGSCRRVWLTVVQKTKSSSIETDLLVVMLQQVSRQPAKNSPQKGQTEESGCG
jgi:hypothetical protein